MSGPTYFISDLHLDAERPAVTAAFGRFLRRITAPADGEPCAAALYILGDLFEFWVGDDDDSALAAEVTGLLRDFRKRGPALYLMHGNRDFLLGEAFCERTGAELLADPTVHTIGDTSCLLMHGDSLCTRDEDYQRFRALARSPAWQADVLGRSLQERRALAAQLRMASKDAGSRKAADIMDVTPTEVEAALRDAHCKVLIHGHTHRPDVHAQDGGTRYVLGDWENFGWYLRQDGGDLSLKRFDIAAS